MFRHLRSLIAICLLLSAVHAGAQQNATVQGTVVDESQAVMPGTTVTATEVSTGTQKVAVAEGDGRYRFDNVAPGKYKLRFELQGFGAVELTDIELLVGANVTVPKVTLKVTSLEETVTVTSQVPLVDGCAHRSPATSTAPDGRPPQGRTAQELALRRGQHCQQRRQHARSERRPVPDEHRRPADHAARGRPGLCS
jgi:hypothetical protein